MNIVAIIPARGGSKGFPENNTADYFYGTIIINTVCKSL